MNHAEVETHETQTGEKPKDSIVKRTKKLYHVVMVAMLSAFIPSTAFAASDPISTFFQNVLDFLTGGLARTLAIIAVVVVGIMALRGKMEWGKVGWIAGGIFLIFGAAAIVDQFAGYSS